MIVEQVIVWNYPDVVFVDRDMIEATTTVTRSSGLGRGSSIKSFVGCSMQVTRPDGAPLHVMTSPYPLVLSEHVARGEWERAMLLCR